MIKKKTLSKIRSIPNRKGTAKTKENSKGLRKLENNILETENNIIELENILNTSTDEWDINDYNDKYNEYSV